MPPRIRFHSFFVLAWLLLPLAAHARPAIGATQTIYLTRCGGCHGIEGASASAVVPDLRGQVGLFLCSGEGRNYMLRVPNVAMSLIRDDAKLADVMNFVVLQFGGPNKPADTRPFTASEIHAARLQPLQVTDLMGLRQAVLTRAITACATQPTMQ